jgi:phosphoglycolate phosphatase
MFDLDGTLTDPYDGITRCVTHAFRRLNRVAPPAAQLRDFIGPPLQESFANWLPPADVEDAIGLYRERFDSIGWRENDVYPGIPELLDDLRTSGHQMIVVTSKPGIYAQRIVDHFALGQFFGRVVGATLDGTLRHKTELIAKALAETGAAATQAVMVGDRSQDIVGAKANAVRAIGAGWGYAHAGELEAAGADAISATPRDLAALVDHRAH